MKTLTFKNKESAEIFKDSAKVTGAYEELEDGSVILAYKYDESCGEKASCNDLDERVYSAICQMEGYIDRRMEYIHDRIDRLYKLHAEHSNGHLPSIKSASQMETALQNLGLGNEYEVKKGVIYVNADGYPYY